MTDGSGGGVTIGIDLGTSGLKAVAVAADGAVLARATSRYETSRPEPGSAEQNPEDWLVACDAALASIARAVPQLRWSAIGLTGMLPTLVSLSTGLEVVGAAITWEDGRAEPQAEHMLEALGAAVVYRTTGQRVDGRYLLPMHLRRVADGAASATWVIGAKDFLLWKLTGQLVTDPSTATGYGCWNLRSTAWDAGIAAQAGAPKLPTVVPSSTSFGLVPEFAARWGCMPGMPVVVGAADSVLGAYGLGVTSAGTIGVIAGTSTVIIGYTDVLRFDPESRYLVTPMVTGGYGVELDLMATGSAFAWLAGLFGLDGGAEELAELAADADLDESPLVLPYFGPGEQGALWDPSLSGLAEGLTLRTTRAQWARGLMAGIVLEAARCVAVVREAQGDGDGAGAIIQLTGSGASERFRQDLADATGFRVRYDPGESDHSALGAALFAGHSALGWDGVAAGDGGILVRPDATQAPRWHARFERHERARSSLRNSAPR